MELVVQKGATIMLRVPLREALVWMATALRANEGDPERAASALTRAFDAYQRSVH